MNRGIKKDHLLGGMSLIAFAVSAISAWTPAPATAAEGVSGGVENIVVTARRREETLQSQALSISALTAQKLEKMNIRSLLDVTNIPNVNMTKQPGFMNTLQVVIRGIGESDPVLTNDQPIALYVDGVLIARSIASQIDLIDPERVEILRGPQGSLFGRNTTGGAVSVTLPGPSDEFAAKVRAGYATNNELTLRGVIDTGEIGSSGIKAKIAIQHHEMDGYVRNTRTSNAKFWPGSDETNSAYLALHGELGTVGTFDYRFDYNHIVQMIGANQLSYVDPGIVSYFSQSPNYGGDPFVYSDQRLSSLPLFPLIRSKGNVMGNALTLNFPISDAFNIKSISAIRSFTTNVMPNGVGTGLLRGLTFTGVDRVSPYSLEPVFGATKSDLSHQRQISQELQFSGVLGKHRYVGGLYYFNEKYYENFHAFGTATNALNPLIPPGFGVNYPIAVNYTGKSESYAVFLSDTYTPSILDDKLELTGGIRYTIDKRTLNYQPEPIIGQVFGSKYRKFSAVSGDATLKYQWTDDFMTYLRFANAYKSGGFSGRDSAAAPGYAPETANNFEVGLKSDLLDRRVRINADVFYTKYTNKQITTFSQGLSDNGANASHVANAGAVEYLGSEVEVNLQPTQAWGIDLSWGHTWPKFLRFDYQPVTNGQIFNIAGSARFPYFSKTSFAIGTQYTFDPMAIGELSVRVDYTYKSGQYFHPSNTFNTRNELIKSGAQTLLNASVNLSRIPLNLGRSEVSVSAYCSNCLDKAFRVVGVDYGVLGFGTNWYNRPRVFGFNLTAQY